MDAEPCIQLPEKSLETAVKADHDRLAFPACCRHLHMQHWLGRAARAPTLTYLHDSLRNPPGAAWPALGNAALQEYSAQALRASPELW